MKRRNWMGYMAVLIVAAMLGTALATSAGAATVISQDEIDSIVNTTTDASQVTSPFTQVANAVRTSIVGVNNYQNVTSYSGGSYFGYGYGKGQGTTTTEQLAITGSGTVVTKYGHILTNYHVVDGASRVTISYDDVELEATVVATDEDEDIAVLLAPGCTLAPVELGDSDQIQVGEYAIVIGNPLSETFARTTTVGVVSAIDRTVTDTTLDRYGRKTTITNQMIQVDAAINSGNSGGGMFNTLGQLMGIPERKYTTTSLTTAQVDNIGMCIPINVAKPLIRQALEAYTGTTAGVSASSGTDNTQNSTSDTASAVRPRMGVKVATLSSSNSAVAQGILPLGAYVTSVEADSPAASAGIQVGDIIVDVNDTVIQSSSQLVSEIENYKEGDVLKIKVWRAENIANAQYVSEIGDGEYIDLEVELKIIDGVNM